MSNQFPQNPEQAASLTLEGVIPYRDRLRLQSFVTRVGINLTDRGDYEEPRFQYIDDIVSREQYLGLEHFYDFNDAAEITSHQRAGVAFKQTIASSEFVTDELKQEFGIRRRSHANPRALSDAEYSQAVTAYEMTAIIQRLEGVQHRDRLKMAPPTSLTQSLESDTLLSTANLVAFSRFAINVGTIIDTYGGLLDLQSEEQPGKPDYFLGALAAQLTIQTDL